MPLSPFAQRQRSAKAPVEFYTSGQETRYRTTTLSSQQLGKGAVELPGIFAALSKAFPNEKGDVGIPQSPNYFQANKAYRVGNKIYTLSSQPGPGGFGTQFSGANVRTVRDDPYQVTLPNAVKNQYTPLRQRLAFATSRASGGFRRPSILG